MPRKKSPLMVSLFLLPWCLGLSAEQDMAVPLDVQYPLFLKILTFDRNLQMRAGEELVIGVVYQPRVRASWLAKDALMKLIDTSSIQAKNLPVRGVPIEARSPEHLARAIEIHRVDVLYVGPLRAVAIKDVTSVSRPRHVITLTGMPRYVDDGLAVGIGLAQERPEILVNLAAARAEGADFKAQFLKLARIIHQKGD